MSGQYPAVPRASAGINHDTHFSNPSIFLVVEQHSTIFEVRKKMFQLFHINYYWIIRKHALKSCTAVSNGVYPASLVVRLRTDQMEVS